MHALLLAALSLSLAAPAGSAKSAADAPPATAAKKKEKPAPRVFTEDDLRHAGKGNVSVPDAGTTAPTEGDAKPAASPSPSGSPGAPAEKTPEELNAERAKAWRQKLDEAQANAVKAQAYIDEAQARANDTTHGLYTPERTALLAALEDARGKLAAVQQQVADLTAEGRRNGWK
jgi:hypothetical protein